LRKPVLDIVALLQLNPRVLAFLGLFVEHANGELPQVNADYGVGLRVYDPLIILDNHLKFCFFFFF
jgi:hypothetical protein